MALPELEWSLLPSRPAASKPPPSVLGRTLKVAGPRVAHGVWRTEGEADHTKVQAGSTWFKLNIAMSHVVFRVT